MPRLYVHRGHVLHADGMNVYSAAPETPREQARKFAAAVARWSAIVDLMLVGMRETGNGKVVKA